MIDKDLRRVWSDKIEWKFRESFELDEHYNQTNVSPIE